MNKRKALIYWVLLMVCRTAYGEPTLTIRSDSWYPMNGAPGAAKPGYMIELAETIMKYHGYHVDYQLLPWKRSLIEVESGNYDCLVGTYKEKHRNLRYPDEPWGIDQVDFYVSKDNRWRFKGLASLEFVRVGLIAGYSYQADLNQLAESSPDSDQFQFTSGDKALELNIKKLLRGRIDTTPESVYVMQAKLMEMQLSDRIVPAGTLTKGRPIYIACSPDKTITQRYIQWLDAGTKRLRASGELAKILSRYGLKDWKKTNSYE